MKRRSLIIDILANANVYEYLFMFLIVFILIDSILTFYAVANLGVVDLPQTMVQIGDGSYFRNRILLVIVLTVVYHVGLYFHSKSDERYSIPFTIFMLGLCLFYFIVIVRNIFILMEVI